MNDALAGRDVAQAMARGVCRWLVDLDHAPVTEFTLLSGRRVDVIALDTAGLVTIVEIKSSVADFRSDEKWPQYLDFCDAFYFAVPIDFPREILPEKVGILAADGYGAAVLREAEAQRINGARRRALILRFARAAGQRLARHLDTSP